MQRHTAPPVLIALATAFAIGVPAWQALSGWGLSAAQFSAQGDATLRAAGYAFSIWGVIYAGLVVFAVAYARGARRDGDLARLGVPASIAIAGCGVWILASGANARWATVAIIIVSAAAGLWATVLAGGGGTLRQRLTTWALPLLGGWLLIASTLNVATIATAEGLLSPAAATSVAKAAAVVLLAVASGAIWRGASALYAVPIVWGLVAVFVAERQRHPDAAAVALAAAAALGVIAALLAWRRARSHGMAADKAG